MPFQHRDQVPHSSITAHDWTEPSSSAYKRAMEAKIPSHMAAQPAILESIHRSSAASKTGNGSKGITGQDREGKGTKRQLTGSEISRRENIKSFLKGTGAGNGKILPTEANSGGGVGAAARGSAFPGRRGTHAGVVESGEKTVRPAHLHLSPRAFMDPDSAAEVRGTQGRSSSETRRFSPVVLGDVFATRLFHVPTHVSLQIDFYWVLVDNGFVAEIGGSIAYGSSKTTNVSTSLLSNVFVHTLLHIPTLASLGQGFLP